MSVSGNMGGVGFKKLDGSNFTMADLPKDGQLALLLVHVYNLPDGETVNKGYCEVWCGIDAAAAVRWHFHLGTMAAKFDVLFRVPVTIRVAADGNCHAGVDCGGVQPTGLDTIDHFSSYIPVAK